MPFYEYYPGGRGRVGPPSEPVSPKTLPAMPAMTPSMPPPLPALRTTNGGPFDSSPLAQYRSFPNDVVPPSTASSSSTTAGGGFGGGATPSIRSLASSSAAPPPLPPAPPLPLAFSHDDTERSRRAYATLAKRAEAYREALRQVSATASEFGAALEACARLKEARDQTFSQPPYGVGGGSRSSGSGGSSIHSVASTNTATTTNTITTTTTTTATRDASSCTADVLQAASGLYYLQASQQGVLSETVSRAFEEPLVRGLDRYGAAVEAEQAAFAAGMRDASRALRRLETEGGQLRRTRRRDLGAMRSHLVAMTAALDALTARQAAHAVALLDQSRAMSTAVSDASRTLVRAELDILDSLARKGWPGGGLDVLLDGADDLFAHDEDDDDTGHATAFPSPHGTVGPTVNGGASSNSALLHHAVASAVAPAHQPSLGPKLLLLGQNGPSGGRSDGSGGSSSRRKGRRTKATGDGGADDDLNVDNLVLLSSSDDDDAAETNGDDDDLDDSDVSTIDGHNAAAPTAADAVRTPRRPQKAGTDKATSTTQKKKQTTRKRVDSLSVDPGMGMYDEDDADSDDDDDDDDASSQRPFRYQSLDSVAAAAATAGSSGRKGKGAKAAEARTGGAGAQTEAETRREPGVVAAGPSFDADDTDEGVHAWRA